MARKMFTNYVITAKENFGRRRVIFTFGKLKDAKAKLRQILSPAKFRIVNGKKMFLTSFRDAQSGTGINNPRIKKIKSFTKFK